MASVQHETLTQEELRTLLEESSMKMLGLSADEFLEQYRKRRLNMAVPSVSRLAMLARVLLATEHSAR